MTRRAALAGAAIVLAGIAAGGWAYARSSDGGPAGAGRPALPTVAVTRGDLTATMQQPGRLGYSGTHTLVGQRSGTVTAMPKAGDVISRGQRAYAVDLRPIPLFYGDLPFYRPLGPGSEGADVRQLESNLVALGHAGQDTLTVDDRYSDTTARAVRRWQKDLGVTETGTLAPGDAVVAADAVRVETVELQVGTRAQPGAALLSGTGTGHSAYVDLPLTNIGYARVGQAVRVQLPGRRTVPGEIVSVGTEAEDQPADQGGTAQQSAGQRSQCQGGNCPQSVVVEIRVTSPAAELGGVEEGPVSVTFATDTRRGVLNVPIAALAPGPAGGFAVVVVDGAGRRSVPVRTGLFTSGRVEVSGDGVAEGVRVEVPTL
jgi:peptidoglycan hydrolase-like protein with peptidoglycan-binding domain